jgi:glucose/arabinose dehydrogenase
MKRIAIGMALFFICALAKADSAAQALLRQLRLPPGFHIELFAEGLPGVRQLAPAPSGLVFAGSRNGAVYALQDGDGDGRAERRYQLAHDLNLPNGVAFWHGDLYIAEIQRISRLADIEQHLAAPPEASTLYDRFPDNEHHGWKYLRVGPDGKLYSAVGAPCNICRMDDPIFASLIRLNSDGSGLEIIAHGVRNSVGFDWEPENGHLFFNDNGRDYLGDDTPPEELNELVAVGGDYGFPFCHGGHVTDPEYHADRACAKTLPPVWRYKAHIAPLGMRFYRGTQFPAQYRHQLFVAQHGSWNRSKPQGYQIAWVKFAGGHPYAEQTFIDGWLTPQGAVLGRPVDVVEWRDGSLLISDDHLGVIYRVYYRP